MGDMPFNLEENLVEPRTREETPGLLGVCLGTRIGTLVGADSL